MRILHVVRGMSNSSGTTHIVRALANHQSQLGHTVRVMTVERRGEEVTLPAGPGLASEVLPGTWVGLQRWRILKNFGYSRPFRQRIQAVIGDTEVVHIHAIWNYPTFCAMKAASRAGVPYAVSPQGSLEDWALGQSQRIKSIYGRYWERELYDRASAMLVLTEAEAEQCRRYGIRSPIERLPNGVEPRPLVNQDERRALRAKWNGSDGVPILLFLSRLHLKKGIDLLIEAVAKVSISKPFEVWIAGHDAHGDLDERLKRMVVELGLRERIRFLGEVRGDAKFELMQAADVFVLPSHSEGMPMAVLEAMSCGTPVMITPGCNLPEVEAAGAGWIVQPKVEALAKAMKSILESSVEWEACGQRARALVEGKFAWRVLAEKSIAIYQRLAAQAKVPGGRGHG